MKKPETNKTLITLTPFYGVIYGAIALMLLAVMTLIPERWVFSSNYRNSAALLIRPAVALNILNCAFKEITGVPCLTCGGTRSTFYLSRLRLKQAWLINPMIFTGFIGVLLWGLISLISIVFYKSAPIKLTLPSKKYLLILLTGAILINWAYLLHISRP
jgi:hypothetical protein